MVGNEGRRPANLEASFRPVGVHYEVLLFHQLLLDVEKLSLSARCFERDKPQLAHLKLPKARNVSENTARLQTCLKIFHAVWSSAHITVEEAVQNASASNQER